MVYNSNIELITGATVASLGDDIYLADLTGGNFTITLPTITANGMQYTVKRIDSTVNVLTIQTSGGQLIEGVTSRTILPNSVFKVESYNFMWYIVLNSSTTTISNILYSCVYVQNNNKPFIEAAGTGTDKIIN